MLTRWRNRLTVPDAHPLTEPRVQIAWPAAVALWAQTIATPHTRANYQRRVETAIQHHLTTCSLGDMTVERLHALGSAVRSDGQQCAGNTTLVALRAFFRESVRQGWVPDAITPALIVTALTGVPHPETPLLPIASWHGICRRLLEAASAQRYYPRQAVAIMGLLVLRGVRASEISTMRVGDVTEHEKGILLQLRGAHRRTISVPPVLHASLRWCAEGATPSSAIFLNRQNGHAFSARSVNDLLAACCQRAGVPHLTTRQLRSAYARHQYKRRSAV